MAEFQEVMRQAKRMCERFGRDCAGCGIAGGHCPLGPIPENWDVSDFENIERIVMDWAAANPEPKYPTWTEWLRTFSADGVDLYAPIPADIAEKLGIKPIGGGRNE